MRWGFFIVLFFVLSACGKQRLTNALEGTWNYTKLLKTNGAYVYTTDTYIFEGGKANGKTFLPLTIFSSDTIQATYCVKKRAEIMEINFKTPNGDSLVSYNVEDWDKNSLIIRGAEGALFLDKL